MQNELAECKHKTQQLKRQSDECASEVFIQTETQRNIIQRLRDFENRLASLRRLYNEKNRLLSDCFCQLSRYEQIQRELEAWVHVKEAECSSISHNMQTRSYETQHKQFERCKVR